MKISVRASNVFSSSPLATKNVICPYSPNIDTSKSLNTTESKTGERRISLRSERFAPSPFYKGVRLERNVSEQDDHENLSA